MGGYTTVRSTAGNLAPTAIQDRVDHSSGITTPRRRCSAKCGASAHSILLGQALRSDSPRGARSAAWITLVRPLLTCIGTADAGALLVICIALAVSASYLSEALGTGYLTG